MFSVEFTYSPAFLLLCAAFAGGLTWWMYRRTRVQLHRAWLFLLAACRFTALFILCVLLLEPLLTSVMETRTPPLVTLLVDDSESMAASTDSVFVKKRLLPQLREFIDELDKQNIRVQIMAFGGETKSLSQVDSLKFQQSGTNIAASLDQVADRTADQNLGAVVLVSDGIYTQGASPIHRLDRFNVPVHAAIVGDTLPARDVLIESVQFNELTYLNTETPIMARIKSQGYGQVQTTAELIWRGKVLQSLPVTLNGNPAVQQVEFRVRATQPGLQQYQIRIGRQTDELSYENNERLLYVKVLENRLKIGLLAGAAHPDLGAIEQALSRDPRYQLTAFVRKNDRDFYVQPTPEALKQQDLFILHNFPVGVQDRAVLEQVFQQVESRNVPLFHIVGTATRFNILPEQTQLMALFPSRISPRTSEAFLYLTPDYKNHSTWRFEDEKAFLEWLENAPPLLRNDSEWQPGAGAKVYGKAKIKGIPLDYPMLAFQENNRRKNIVLVGENIWRHRVQNFADGERFTEFDTWFYNMLQWLSTREDNRRFRVFPAKYQFDGKEPAVIKAQVYDDSNMPVEGAEIRLTLTDPDGKKSEFFLRQNQPGAYQVEMGNLVPGAYSYEATGSYRGQRLGTDAGQFSVGKSAVEFADLTAKPDVLRQVALRTGGAFATAAQMKDKIVPALLKQENLRPLVELQRSTLGLNQYLWPLILVLLLLAVEWILRKRNGMI